MKLDLDTLIFVGFLAINLIVGLFYSRGIKKTEEYAVGSRNFSTTTIVTTTVATCIGAGIFSAAISESYRQGLYFIIPIFGQPICFLVTAYILIPKMGFFLNTLSVAEAIGKLYGNHVRIISAISGALLSTGCIAMQFKVSASVMQIFFGIDSVYALILSFAIVIIYSSFGGIRSVAFTDLLQCFTFCTILPIICVAIWQNTGNDIFQILSTALHTPKFDLAQIVDINNPRFLSSILLLFIFIIPALDPTYFQRIAMSRGVEQAKKSFVISGSIVAIIILVTCWIGVLLYLSNSNLNPDNLLSYIISTYAYTGLKGLTAAGIMAIIMSTADSYINSASVLICHDIIEPLNKKLIPPQSKLLLLRVSALCIGSFALLLAIKTGGILQLIVKSLSFYMPVVSVPLILAILGYRSTTKVIILSMIGGALAVIACYSFGIYEDGEATIGMLVNLIIFIIFHNIWKNPKKKENKYNEIDKKFTDHQKQHNPSSFFETIRKFSINNFYDQNSYEKNYVEVIVGVFSIVNVFLTLHFTSKISQANAEGLFNFVYHSTLICAFLLFSYPIWSTSIQKERYKCTFKIISISYTLVFIPMLLIMISNFAPINLMIFLVNIVTFIILTRWQLALCTLTIFSYLSLLIYEQFKNGQYIEQAAYFGVPYTLIFICASLIAFLKPKQEAQELSNEMVDHLAHTVEDQNNQISELSNLKQTFLRNLQHETNTPITGIYSMSQALQDCYDKLTDQQRKNSIDTIVASSERLISYANNLIDISKLTNQNYTLKLREVNLSNLLEECIRKCKRLYISKDSEENRKFEVTIEPDLKTNCDEYYIRKSFENLLINAVQYCKKGKIFIVLTKIKNGISLAIKDSGIGIPKEELNIIFNPFTTSSKTTTPAGGRGIGLTSVKAIAEAHGATVIADSDGINGSTFTMIFPTKM